MQGFLYQPHTSAGRVPTAAGLPLFRAQVATRAKLSEEDRKWIRSELEGATTAEEMTERAGHVLAAVSRGLGIIVTPPLACTALEHIRFLQLPDGRVVVVLDCRGRRDARQSYAPRTRLYPGGSGPHRGILESPLLRLDARSDPHRSAGEVEYRSRAIWALAAVLWNYATRHCSKWRVRGKCIWRAPRRLLPRRSFWAPSLCANCCRPSRKRASLVALLNGCIETPEPVHIQIGVKEITAAGEHLSLITAPYLVRDSGQGSLGVLGPMRMQYERAITAVAYVAQAFSEAISRG